MQLTPAESPANAVATGQRSNKINRNTADGGIMKIRQEKYSGIH